MERERDLRRATIRLYTLHHLNRVTSSVRLRTPSF